MQSPHYPSLYQINTRVWLTEISETLGRAATLDDVPDLELDRLARMGFDWIWLLSVWQTGEAAQKISRANPEWRHEFQETLPDLRERDIAGSGFAITGYTVHSKLGGDAALARIRKRLRDRGLRLMLDFVPNHTAPDHPWVEDYPDYYIAGTDADLAQAPQNYTRVKLRRGEKVLAFGRDPYFAGWPDTLQLDYSNPETQEAMRGELLRIAGQCDGVRCDMAMLVLPDVFERTWGRRAPLFWPETTRRVRERRRGSASWLKSIGTSNGRCSNRGSTTHTTSGFTIAYVKATPDPCGSICLPVLTIRTSSPVSWRITTSHARPPLSRRKCTKPPLSLRFYRRDYGSFIKVNLKGAGSASHRILYGRRSKHLTKPCSSFTNACSTCWRIQP